MTRILVRGVVIALAVSVLAAAPADAAKLNTKIKSGPTGFVSSNSATFKFKSTKSGSTFKCKLDGQAFKGCTSPTRYTGLSQGKHTFQVVASKAGKADKSPAKRSFTVDTVAPNTTVASGPTGRTFDSTPSFTFSSNEPGTFSCRIDSGAFQTCASPFTPAAVSEAAHTFQVRARDKAGNVDKTAASRQFEFVTPIVENQATADEAAELYFPDAELMDVPANCAGPLLTFDCPDSVADPPADQLSVTSTRAVVDGAGEHAYDVTVTSGVTTPIDIKMNGAGGECTLDFVSAFGAQNKWTVTMTLSFVEVDGALQIQHSSPDVTGIELADIATNGAFPCGSLVTASVATAESLYVSALLAHFASVGDPLCAASGPAYLGPCPP